MARRLNVPRERLSRFIDLKEGLDPHDWVNDLGDEFGRQIVLKVLAEQWIDLNGDEVESFKDDIGKLFNDT